MTRLVGLPGHGGTGLLYVNPAHVVAVYFQKGRVHVELVNDTEPCILGAEAVLEIVVAELSDDEPVPSRLPDRF